MAHMTNSMHVPPDRLTQADFPPLPPLRIDIATAPYQAHKGQSLHLLDVQLLIEGFEHTGAVFTALYRNSWTSQSFEIALKWGQATGAQNAAQLPLIVLPFLDDDKLATLAERQISGLDLCGNALLIIPGKVMVQRSGQPNRFRLERGLKSPYTGKAALVGRALLMQPHFATATDLLNYIRVRGGKLSQALVSRTLKALGEDLVVSSDKGQGLLVLQPTKLLDQLVKGWQASTGGLVKRHQRLLWRGKVNLPPEQLLAALTSSAVHSGQRFTATGLLTSSRYTNLSSGAERSAYVDSVGTLLNKLEAEETQRFPNLELWRAPDDAVYFDTVTSADGITWASALQTYLELATGDARTQQAALPLREGMLEEAMQKLNAAKESGSE